MVLTCSFRDLAGSRIEAIRNSASRFCVEALTVMLSGDVDGGKAILRDEIKATIGFEKLFAATGTRPESGLIAVARNATAEPIGQSVVDYSAQRLK